ADYQTSQKSLNRLTLRYPATLLDGLLALEAFKLDQAADLDYVENWAMQLRQHIEDKQPSLRPELGIETFEKEDAEGNKSVT
ncbi:hypothetical protein VXE41_22680, partial [Acinetobacter variabilis]